MAETLSGLGAQLAEKQKRLAEFFTAHKTTDKERPYDMTAEDIAQVKAWNAELDEIGKEFGTQNEMAAMEAKSKEYGSLMAAPQRLPMPSSLATTQPVVAKSLGELFLATMYKEGVVGRVRQRVRWDTDVEAKESDGFEYKTTMTTAAGFAPEHPRSGKVQLYPTRPIRLFDVVPTITMSTDNTYVYMLESTFTNNAAEAAENAGSAWGEAALVYTETSVVPRKVAVWLPVTDEQLSDEPGMRQLIDNRLSTMVMLKAESQALQGDGNSPNINGYHTQVTQAQALGSDPPFDAIYKGMTKVRHTGFAEPTAVVIHPNDWQDFRLMRTLDGIYIMGNPADPGPERLFGVPVVVTSAAVENTALVGDFQTHSAIIVRQGIEFKISDSHSDYFVKGLQAIRACMRLNVVVYRLEAFCEITGL